MPPASYTITAADKVTARGADFFRITFRRDDSLLHGYFFPVETLTCRAAELGLDVDADTEQLLDIVLHEPFINGEAPPQARGQHPHLARIADAKTRVTIRLDPTLAADPLDVIRRHRIPPEQVRAIHDQVRHARPAEPPADESAILRHEMT